MGALASAGLLLTGCSGPPAPTQEELECTTKSALTEFDHLGDAAIVYEVDQRASSFSIEPNFLAQMETWHLDWQATSDLPHDDQVWSYGAFVRDGLSCDSWHGAGRAFDISQLRHGDDTIVSCREDLWAELGDVARRDDLRRRYWSLAASLHLHFAYVLTYLYDPAHRNHIHVDNSVSRSGMSVFDRTSRVQLHMVQTACAVLWDVEVEPSEQWDRQTRNASHVVLEKLGAHGDVGRSDNWEAFLRGCVPRAAALS